MAGTGWAGLMNGTPGNMAAFGLGGLQSGNQLAAIKAQYKGSPPLAGTSNVAPTGVGSQNAGPTTVTIPGYTPDYGAILAADPGVQAARAQQGLSDANAAAQRIAAVRALVTSYGGLPSGTTDPYGDVNVGVLQQAQQNPYSTLATETRNYNQATRSLDRQLAARGALHSGDLTFGMNQLNYQKGATGYADAQQFANALQQAVNNYVATKSGNAQNALQALLSAEGQYITNPAYTPTQDQQATHAGFDANGNRVFATADGTTYLQNPDGSFSVYTGKVFPNGPSASVSNAPTASTGGAPVASNPLDALTQAMKSSGSTAYAV